VNTLSGNDNDNVWTTVKSLRFNWREKSSKRGETAL